MSTYLLCVIVIGTLIWNGRAIIQRDGEIDENDGNLRFPDDEYDLYDNSEKHRPITIHVPATIISKKIKHREVDEHYEERTRNKRGFYPTTEFKPLYEQKELQRRELEYLELVHFRGAERDSRYNRLSYGSHIVSGMTTKLVSEF
ncbi:hypothetical protein ACOME3_007542 [Neoechinorhynchus agilis]